MTEETEKGKHKLAETNNGTKQELFDSAMGESGVLAEHQSLKELPPEARKIIEVGMMSSFGPIPNPLANKITEKHIDKLLDISARDDERSFKDTA